jgi:trafficking protein particle complex subunit 8
VARAFVPHVAVLASTEVEDLAVQKGFSGGLLELLRPYGEKINGKVTVRDSGASSRTLEEFSVRFTGLRDGLEAPRMLGLDHSDQLSNGNGLSSSNLPIRLRTGGHVAQIEELVDRHLLFAESSDQAPTDYLNFHIPESLLPPSTSPFYSLYLRRLLSGLPMTPHETFSHPVACIIAISPRTPSPIEELRRLYASTNTGEHRLPQWVNNDYLRYYILVHDEDNDDIPRSQALFEQMKRHFGLHCHLLRLRSSRALPSDDDSRRLPACEWISAAEELTEIRRRGLSNPDQS